MPEVTTPVTETPAAVATPAATPPKPKTTKKLANKAKGGAKKATKKAKTAKAAKAPKAKKAKNPNEVGTTRDHDLPWNEKKVALFKALRSPKLQGGIGTAAQLIAIAGEDKLNGRDVRHYSYHAAAGGLVKIHQPGEGEGIGYSFSLTAKGKAIDPVAAYKEQEKAKAAK